MTHFSRILATAALLLAAPSTAWSDRILVLPPGPADLLPTRLIAPEPSAEPTDAPREPVTFSWALDANAPLAPPTAFIAESKEFWLRVSGAELSRGVRLPTTAAGALVRLSPAPGSRSITPALGELELRASSGRAFAAGQGIRALASAEALAAIGAEFAPGTVAFPLREEVGAGAVTLAWAGADAESTYVLQVVDRAGGAALRLASDRPFYLDGDRLILEATLAMPGRRLALDHATGFVLSPAGRAWPLSFTRQPRGSWRAELALDAREEAAPGLWQIELQAGGRQGELEVLRNARTAFSCALPTARFSNEIELSKAPSPGALQLSLGVVTAAAGRYEARAVIFGTDPASGALKPLAAAHSAAWLEGGRGALELRVEPAILAASRLTAPYEVRELELRDQGRMGILERRERALMIRP